MKQKALATALALAFGAGTAHAVTMSSATFTMHDPMGDIVNAPPDTAVTGSIGGGTWSVASTTSFLGVIWAAHGGTTFGPGTYTFDTIEGGVYNGIVVGPGQVGGHILWDWAGNLNIDIINVWDVSTSGGVTTYTATDIDGDGIPGIEITEPPFENFSVTYEFTTPVPVPSALWLFASGLLALLSSSRRKQG